MAKNTYSNKYTMQEILNKIYDPDTDTIAMDLGTALSGEDSTNDVIKVEQRYSFTYCTADTLVKNGAGFLHTVTFAGTDAAATAGSIILYDSITEAAPIIFTYYVPAAALVPVTVTLDVNFTNGLYVGYTTTNDVCTTISFR